MPQGAPRGMQMVRLFSRYTMAGSPAIRLWRPFRPLLLRTIQQHDHRMSSALMPLRHCTTERNCTALPYCSAPALGAVSWEAALQPTAHGTFVIQVVGTEPPFEVPLLSWDHDGGHEGHGRDECGDQPHAVDPTRDPQLQEGERQVDRVPTEAIGARADHDGGRLVAGHRRARRLECPDGVGEDDDGDHHEDTAEQSDESTRKEWEGPAALEEPPRDHCGPIHQWRSRHAEIRDRLGGVRAAVVVRPGVHGGTSLSGQRGVDGTEVWQRFAGKWATNDLAKNSAQ